MEEEVTKNNINNDKIIVEIAAYLDPELLNTVNSAIIQADNPDRVYFAICYQNDDLEDYYKLKEIKNCKIIRLKEEETKGACYARYLCQSLIEDEKYIFQVDSHMRFVKHWDTKMIENLLSLNDPKGIISFYPQNCTEEMMKYKLDDPFFDTPTYGGAMYTAGFGETTSYFLKNRCLPLRKGDPKHKKKNAFISAGNFFTYSEAHKIVLHDPKMYFYGDETPMSIRLFTHGWNVYNFDEGYVYHQYERKNQKFSPVKNAMLNELKRFKSLLKIDESEELEEFGLGNERTLEEYESFAGIDFKNKKIKMSAEIAEFENEYYKNKTSYSQRKKEELYKLYNKKSMIEVLIVDIFDDYQNCIKSCLRKAEHQENIKFVVGTTSKQEYSDISNIKKIVHFNNNESYSEILSSITQYIGNDYVAIIDSSIRFLKEWDSYILNKIKLCSKKTVLTTCICIADEDTDIENFIPYNNIIKDFKEISDYMPLLKYNEEIDLSKRKNMFHTPFISDGFIFCHSSVIKKIPFDPKLNYEEQKFVYSARLWTNGIDIYYPQVSHYIRTREEFELYNGKDNYEAISNIFGINNFYSKSSEYNYQYDIGKERPLWTYYEFMGYDFEPYLD